MESQTFQVSHRWTVTTVKYTAGVTIVYSLSPFSYKKKSNARTSENSLGAKNDAKAQNSRLSRITKIFKF